MHPPGLGVCRWRPLLLATGIVVGSVSAAHSQRQLFDSSGRVAATETRTMRQLPQAEVVALGETIVFVADEVEGLELFVSDGTKGGTRLLANIDPERSSRPTDLTVVGDLVFFVADDGHYGRELWCTDGTTEGTHMVRDINPGGYDSRPERLLAVDELLFFVADDGFHGRELWRSDGTEEGTFLVIDIEIGPRSSDPSRKSADGDLVYFSAFDSRTGRSIWRSDGSTTGTLRMVDSFAEGPDEHGDPEVCNGLVFFSGWTKRYGRELWALDAATEEVFLVADVNPGGRDSDVGRMFPVGDRVYFSAQNEATGRELWCSDGTEFGTFLVSDIENGTGSSNPGDYFSIGRRCFFTALDRSGWGRELWSTDGTLGGTQVVRDINGGAASAFEDRYFVSLVAFEGGALFMADDGNFGNELWFTDGTRAGTRMVADFNPFGDSRGPAFDERRMGFALTRDRIYFGANSGDGPALWSVPKPQARPSRRRR